ncbi:hypothetical protein Dimus_019078 [Dionaea muscipula]
MESLVVEAMSGVPMDDDGVRIDIWGSGVVEAAEGGVGFLELEVQDGVVFVAMAEDDGEDLEELGDVVDGRDEWRWFGDGGGDGGAVLKSGAVDMACLLPAITTF